MAKSQVYFTKDLSSDGLIRVYETLELPLSGKIAIKVSTGEPGGHNFLDPQLIKGLVQKVNGTIVECNTAYAGGRDQTERHLQTAKEHGFMDIANVDIMDAEGEIELPVRGGKHLDVDIVGKNIEQYDGMINLAHFKGHQMAGFGGVIKNQSIGVASAVGKVYIHTAGKSRDLEKFLHCFDTEENMAEMLPAQDDFLEAMAESAKAVADYFHEQDKPLVYINVINNLSVDCDCSANPEAPCMADIGIAASLDPVALDEACLDMIYASKDPGRNHFVERVEGQHGRHTVDYAARLGLGSQEYELVELS